MKKIIALDPNKVLKKIDKKPQNKKISTPVKSYSDIQYAKKVAEESNKVALKRGLGFGLSSGIITWITSTAAAFGLSGAVTGLFYGSRALIALPPQLGLLQNFAQGCLDAANSILTFPLISEPINWATQIFRFSGIAGLVTISASSFIAGAGIIGTVIGGSIGLAAIIISKICDKTPFPEDIFKTSMPIKCSKKVVQALKKDKALKFLPLNTQEIRHILKKHKLEKLELKLNDKQLDDILDKLYLHKKLTRKEPKQEFYFPI